MDVSKFGDMIIRDISVRNIKTVENAKVGGNLEVNGTLLLNGENILDKLNSKPVDEPEKIVKSVILLNEQDNPSWRLLAVDDLLLFQKNVDGEWVNKQALS